jgi:hypothetical protein
MGIAKKHITAEIDQLSSTHKAILFKAGQPELIAPPKNNTL